MSNLTTDVRRRDDVARHLPSLPAPPAHVGLADRLALRLGLWLLVHSTERVRHRTDRAARARRVRNERDREARELAYERRRLLWPPR